LFDDELLYIWDKGDCKKELILLSKAFGFPIVKGICSDEEMEEWNVENIFH